MAKVKAPLMSFDARGKIANSLVYLGWKGLKTVRQYVIPANPKTEDQKKQRNYFKLGVAEWHTDGFTSDDVKAWKLLALAIKEALSGFNIYMRLKLKALIKPVSWDPITGVEPGTPTSSGTTITATGKDTVEYELKYGVTNTAMYNPGTVTNTAGDLSCTLADLVADTTYYFYIKDKTEVESARTGIYTFKTLPAE